MAGAMPGRPGEASGGWFDPWAMPGGFDPTGLVKGWAVDRALDVLRRAGLAGALVNGGGDLAAFGSPAPGQRWRMGIQHPWWRAPWPASSRSGPRWRPRAPTSAGAAPHRPGDRPGLPAAPRPATVTGPSLAMADALATAVAVGGDEALAVVGGIEGYAAYLIRPDGSERATAGFTFVS